MSVTAALDGVDVSARCRRSDRSPLEAYAETLLPKHQFNWSGFAR